MIRKINWHEASTVAGGYDGYPNSSGRGHGDGAGQPGAGFTDPDEARSGLSRAYQDEVSALLDIQSMLGRGFCANLGDGGMVSVSGSSNSAANAGVNVGAAGANAGASSGGSGGITITCGTRGSPSP